MNIKMKPVAAPTSSKSPAVARKRAVPQLKGKYWKDNEESRLLDLVKNIIYRGVPLIDWERVNPTLLFIYWY